jgi:hypothetical protein
MMQCTERKIAKAKTVYGTVCSNPKLFLAFSWIVGGRTKAI